MRTPYQITMIYNTFSLYSECVCVCLFLTSRCEWISFRCEQSTIKWTFSTFRSLMSLRSFLRSFVRAMFLSSFFFASRAIFFSLDHLSGRFDSNVQSKVCARISCQPWKWNWSTVLSAEYTLIAVASSHSLPNASKLFTCSHAHTHARIRAHSELIRFDSI